MKRLILLAIAFCPVCAFAQTYSNAAPENDIRGRASVTFDKKLAKGLHVNVSEEFRVRENFSQVDRSYSSAGIDWKVFSHLKLGADYTFMKVNDTDGWETRNRAAANVTGLYRIGPWHFSLRERIQATFYSKDKNPYQKPDPALALRSRLKCSYAFYDRPFEPYLSFEVRNTLNAVDYKALASEPGSAIYNNIYVNRLRTAVGTEWILDSRSSFDFFILYDYVQKEDIDATRKGKLKSVTGRIYNIFSLGIAYNFGL